MSLLSRQLLKHIKKYKVLEFNPYILTSQIDYGMWAAPKHLETFIYQLEDSHSIEYMTNMVKYPINIFLEHEANFLELLN